MSARPLTGRKVFLFAVAAFGVVIAVNLVLAFKAVGTFPGLEVRNGYVASQGFDAERAAQEALGWTTALSYTGGALRLDITGPDGRPVEPATLKAVIGRPTTTRDDREVAFAFDGEAFTSRTPLEPGNWNLMIEASAADGTRFRQRLVLHVRSAG